LHAIGEAFRDDAELDLIHGNAVYLDDEDRPYLADLGGCLNALCISTFPPQRSPAPARVEEIPVPQPTVYFRRRLWERHAPLDEAYHHLAALDFLTRFPKDARACKLHRTQALCRGGVRRSDWDAVLAELYRFNRNRWPNCFSRGFRPMLRRYVAGFMRSRFPGRRRDLGFWSRAAFVALCAVTRIANPERWWAGQAAPPRLPLPPFDLVARLPWESETAAEREAPRTAHPPLARVA
jgi:hypothetical protein